MSAVTAALATNHTCTCAQHLDNYLPILGPNSVTCSKYDDTSTIIIFSDQLCYNGCVCHCCATLNMLGGAAQSGLIVGLCTAQLVI